MIYPIVKYGDPVLETQAELVTEFDTPELHKLIADMFESMYAARGVGLAAPQIGIDRRVAIVRPPDHGQTLTLINPRIVEESVEIDEQYEGCLSFFDVRGMVPRALVINVEHQDIDGCRHITCFERGMARLVAHEIDHLDGRLYTDRMGPGIEPVHVSEYSGTGRTWRY